MEDYLIFWKMEDDLIFYYMEDDLNILANRGWPQYFENETQLQSLYNK